MLILISILLYIITNWRLFYWLSAIMIICYLAAIAFSIGTLIGIFLQEDIMKEENKIINYETIDIVKQRDLLETTRNIGRLLAEEEFNEIMMIYKKVIDRLWNELEF